MNFAQTKREAEAAVARGGDTKWPKEVLRLIGRVHELERELQESRQLTLFGDVRPPPKTPIGT